MEKRCIWTNRKSDRVKEITIKITDRFGRKPYQKKVWVLPEYEKDLRDFNEYAVKYSYLFLWLVLGLPFIPVFLSMFLFLEIITGTVILTVVGITTILIGLALIKFPFTTPETVNMIGLKSSIKTAKIIGAGVIILGLGAFAMISLV